MALKHPNIVESLHWVVVEDAGAKSSTPSDGSVGSGGGPVRREASAGSLRG